MLERNKDNAYVQKPQQLIILTYEIKLVIEMKQIPIQFELVNEAVFLEL